MDLRVVQAAASPEASHEQAKRHAILSGLEYIRTLGAQLLRNESLAERHGADILLPFFIPQPAMPASREERVAFQVASELAAAWHSRMRARRLPMLTAASTLLDLMQGLYSIECIGRSDSMLRQQLESRAACHKAASFFRFDPREGEPAAGLREDCMCGAKVACDAQECATCRRPAVAMNRFDVWLEALVWSFHG
ncbi:MAG: hypothetical protein SGPRY_012240, partial [Prymnesium sp.]